MSDIKPFRIGGDALSEQTGKTDTIEKLVQTLFEKKTSKRRSACIT